MAFLVFRCFRKWGHWAVAVLAEMLGAVERLAAVDWEAVDWDGLDSVLIEIGEYGAVKNWRSAVFLDRVW